MLKRAFKAGACLAVFATIFAGPIGAQAADIPPPPPPPSGFAPPDMRPAVFRWAGPYGGFHAGWAFYDTDFTEIPGGDPNVSGDGFVGGGLLGYNFQDGSLVYGVEGDVSLGDVTGQTNGHRFDLDITATLRGRVGFASSSGLYYLTAGIGMGELDIKSVGFGGKDNQLLFGLMAGAGAEWLVGNGISLRTEYIFSHYDDSTFNLGGGSIDSGLDEVHTVRAAIVFDIGD